VPEDVLGNNRDVGQLPPFGPLFLECDSHGRVLWMSRHARERLGDAANLLDVFTATLQLSHFLEGSEIQTISGIFDRGARSPVPVELSCVMRAAGNLILSVQVRERASDHMQKVDGKLTALQNRTFENYFRLLRLQQALDSRPERRRPPAAIISEQLERERARLARELHTGAGQLLAAIRVHVELIENKAPDLSPDVSRLLSQIAQLARDAAAEVSAVSRRLHPLDWKAMALTEALRRLWSKSGMPERFQGSLNLAELRAEPPHPVRVAVYRIAQESIANAIRHSGATRVSLSLEEAKGRIILRIEDNGDGFDAGLPPQSGGLGLRAIRDQVHNLEGDLTITSGAEGTKLEVSIPLESCDE